MSSFDGSNGKMLVTLDKSYLWTDGRYFLQAELDLKNTEIKLMKMDTDNTPSLLDFIKTELNGKVLGFDGTLVSSSFGKALDGCCTINNMEEPYLKTPIFKLVWKCVPWIICLMVLQIGTAFITSTFEHLLSTCTILAVFSPLITDAGGNSGGQTTTLIVRSMSLDEFEEGDFKRVVWKELRVALIIAGAIGLFAFGWTFFEMAVLGMGDKPQLITLNGADNPVVLSETMTCLVIAGLIGSTLFVTMIVSRMIGCCLPFFAKLIHVDPAVMCGPFTTTVVDVISLLTYFLLWSNVFAPMLF